MTPRLLLLLCVVSACSANSSGAATPTCDAGADDTPTSGGLAPFTSCLLEITDAGRRTSSGVCASNPALDGCQMCLELDDLDAGDDNNFCVFACRVGMSDCPAGQTCLPQPGLSRSTQGSCRSFDSPSALGYCR